MTSDIGPPLIGALLRVPTDEVRRRILEGLARRGYDDLVPAHLTVLGWPGPEGLRPSDLAARTGMTRQAVNYLLGQLEALGYLDRRPDPGAARVTRIHLTARGRRLIPAIRGIVVDEIERDWEQALGREDFAELRRLLRRLNDVVAGGRPGA